MSPVLICPKCAHTQHAPRKPRRYVVEITLSGARAWLTDRGLAVREQAHATRWETQAEAHAYAGAHLDDKTVRHVRVTT
jgi:hypothetical protein